MRCVITFAGMVLLALQPLAPAWAGEQAGEILQRYAEAWRGRAEMPLEQPVTLAITIEGAGGGEFTVTLPPDGPGQLEQTAALDFAVGFATDIGTLRRLDRGEINALTALGQARASDPTPLRLRVPDGFRWSAAARDFLLPLSFHFWNRAWPETVAFNEAAARRVHGGNAVVLYYQAGMRSAWYQLKPGMHINADPADQVNDFKSLVVVTRGAFSARLDGREQLLREGEALVIGAGMAHEFWAAEGQYGELVLVMFGEGA